MAQAETPQPRPDLDQLVAHYCDLLGLRDWVITAEWVNEPGPLGYVIPTPTRKIARLCISTACPPEEVRATIAHELIHALLSPLTHVAEPSAGALMLEEQAVESLALAVVTAERNPIDAAAMRQALNGLDPRAAIRARVAAAAGRGRNRMDPKMLAALALEGGALMANETLPEEVAAWIKKAVEAMSGGALPSEEPAPESNPEPSADARPMADDEDDDEEDKDKDEEYRKRKRIAVRKLGRAAMKALGEKDPVRARGVLGARLEQAAELVAMKARLSDVSAKSEAARREKLWEDAVRDRRVQMRQAFVVVDGASGKPERQFAKWAQAQNAAYPEIEAFEAWISSRVPEPGAKAAEPSTALADLAVEKRAAFALSERDKLEAKRAGVDPEVLSRQLAVQQRGATGAGERV